MRGSGIEWKYIKSRNIHLKQINRKIEIKTWKKLYDYSPKESCYVARSVSDILYSKAKKYKESHDLKLLPTTTSVGRYNNSWTFMPVIIRPQNIEIKN